MALQHSKNLVAGEQQQNFKRIHDVTLISFARPGTRMIAEWMGVAVVHARRGNGPPSKAQEALRDS
jgi:hypothetical protein